jgi:tetratricopeptide (TPR) repeat protein
MHIRAATLLLATIVFTAALSHADIIRLINGGELRGEIIERSGGVVRIRTARGEITLREDEILRIEVESATETLISRAKQLSSAGDLDGALRKLAEASRAGADKEQLRRLDLTFRKYESERLENEGRFTEAYNVLVDAKKVAPDNAEIDLGLQRLERHIKEVAGGADEAKRALASGDGLRAVSIYERILKESPSSRESLRLQVGRAYVKAGWNLLDKNDIAALDMFQKALEFAPEEKERLDRAMVVAHYTIIQEMQLNERYKEAFAESEKLFASNPDLAFVIYQHAWLMAQLKKRVAARDELLKILPEDERNPSQYSFSGNGWSKLWARGRKASTEALREFREAATQQRDEQSVVEATDDQTLEGRLFTVIHRNEKLARQVLEIAERHTDAIMTLLDRGGESPWVDPCTILVMPDRETYLDKSGMPEWSAGASHTTILEGGAVLKSISIYQTNADLLDSTVPHEAAHVVFTALTDHDPGIPIAIHEGFAVSMEPGYSPKDQAPLLLWSRLTGQLIPLRELFIRRRIGLEANIFYPESASLVHYLVDLKDWPTFLAFSTDLADKGATVALAIHYQIPSIDALEKAWLDSLSK